TRMPTSDGFSSKLNPEICFNKKQVSFNSSPILMDFLHTSTNNRAEFFIEFTNNMRLKMFPTVLHIIPLSCIFQNIYKLMGTRNFDLHFRQTMRLKSPIQKPNQNADASSQTMKYSSVNLKININCFMSNVHKLR
ncbi:hypothetical protein L9F63_000067, partial [Diploptera punctata]